MNSVQGVQKLSTILCLNEGFIPTTLQELLQAAGMFVVVPKTHLFVSSLESVPDMLNRVEVM